MKKINLLILLLFPIYMFSQTSLKDGILIRSHSFDKSSDNQLVVSMVMAVAEDFKVSSNRMVTITPYLESKDMQYNKVLQPVYLYGRNREMVQKRENKIDPNAYRILKRQNGTIQNVNYLVNLPYESWMNGANVKLNIDLCGCADKNEVSDQKDVAQVMIGAPAPEVPLVAFVTPQVEEVKNRTDIGKAYLSFPVNRSVILPSFGNNESELSKIKNTINLVKDDKNTTITKIRIVGYASPEGSYQNNARLSEARAEALKNYVASIYNYGNNVMSVSSVAEDWAGVKQYVEESNIDKKQDILDIINNSSLNDDQREQEIKNLGGNIYSTLYNDCYPSLRRCDYLVDYNVRNFTLEEAKQIMSTHPKQLSLNEMYRVAQTYKSGSPEFNDIFETAVRLFPDDPTANLNASAIALQHNELNQAQKYLSKSNMALPATLNNMGVLMMLKGNIQQAKDYFTKAYSAGNAEAADNLKKLQDINK